jgi:hypothetical protein
MKFIKSLSVAILSVALLAGCASVAHVEKDETVNFSNYRSYAWAESRDNGNDSAKTKLSDIAQSNLREAVNAELAKAGWKESKRPDVLIAYEVAVERSIRQQNNPVYSQPMSRAFYNPYSRRWVNVFYPSEFLGYDRESLAVREGTITISLIDAKTDKTIWQGWTTDELSSRNINKKEIKNGVKSIFRKFDIAKN